jgi:hypothetical protein
VEASDTGLGAALRAAGLVVAEASGSLAVCEIPGGVRVRATFPSAT